jgi:hypothetical protein
MLHFITVRRRRQQMPSWANVLGNGSISRQEPLGMTGRFEALHATLPLTCWPMRVLTPVVERATLAMLYTWQELALRRSVALQLIRDDHPWDIL